MHLYTGHAASVQFQCVAWSLIGLLVCLSVCLIHYLDGSPLGFFSMQPRPQGELSYENLNGL